jgi:transposase
VTNPTSGEVTDVEVFVAILGASQLIYAEAVETQNKEDFITACRNAVEYFGGSPDAIVPDNLRAAVTKSNKFEAEINRSFEDFASHYGMSVLPARAYRPRDKALVEGAVKIVYQKIFAPLRDEIFQSLAVLNAAIWLELDALNASPFKDRMYSRRLLFEEIERDVLAPLPRIRYELRTELRATVMKNGHVPLSIDKHYYSVPHTLIGLKVKLLFTQTSVDIYYLHQCVASHARSRRPYGYTTDRDHLASTHRFVTEWSAEKFLAWARSIDTEVYEYIKRIFELAQHPEQAYRSCLGILGYIRKVGQDRLINACRRASEYGIYNYRIIRSILERGLDSHDAADHSTGSIPDHDNIRGSEHYGRENSNNNTNEGDDDEFDNVGEDA